MKKRIVCLFLLLIGLSGLSASATLTPTGTYSITLAQKDSMGYTTWWDTVVVDLTGKTIDSSRTLVATQNGLNYYMQQVANPTPEIYAFTWYIQPVIDGNPILGGNLGDKLTVSVTGMHFVEPTPDQTVIFQKDVTHIYYMTYIGNGNCLQVAVPGKSLTDPYDTEPIWQRSPVAPLSTPDPDFPEAGSAYGTPYLVWVDGTSFVLPDMWTPTTLATAVTHELSFGAGFTVVPEPITFVLLSLGVVGLVHKKR
jgi:hypothetical protein